MSEWDDETALLSDLPPGKLLLAASTGGHLAQLVRLSDRLVLDDDSLWITFDSEQSRSLLAGRRVLTVPYIAPRDWRGAFKAWRRIAAELRDEHFDLALSTGAALAVPTLGAAKRAGIPTRYVESISRTRGPSLAGRMVHAARLGTTFTQHAGWATSHWRPEQPVLADYSTLARDGEPRALPHVFVTLGTIQPYRFDALVDRLLEQGLVGASTVWQVGCTPRGDLPGTVHEYLSADEFHAHCLAADAVVTHAGVGTIMDLLDAGIAPVVVPREQRRGEHVDDHQMQIFRLLEDQGVAVPARVEELGLATIQRAASSRTVRAGAER